MGLHERNHGDILLYIACILYIIGALIYNMQVGHTFLLGTQYTTPLGAHYINTQGKRVPLYMGCYGLGLSRILLASVTKAPTSLSNCLLWPWAIVPYKLCIIGPKVRPVSQPYNTNTNFWYIYSIADVKIQVTLLYT